MVELVARFEVEFKASAYNKDTVCELFKHLQDLVISRASDLQNELHGRVVDLCEAEGNIVKALSSPREWSTSEGELTFYSTVHRLITECIRDLEGDYYWLFLDQLYQLSALCKSASE